MCRPWEITMIKLNLNPQKIYSEPAKNNNYLHSKANNSIAFQGKDDKKRIFYKLLA